VRNCCGGPQDILEVGDSYLFTSDRTQRSNFPVTSSYLSLEFGATAFKCLIRGRDGRASQNATPVIEGRGVDRYNTQRVAQIAPGTVVKRGALTWYHHEYCSVLRVVSTME